MTVCVVWRRGRGPWVSASLARVREEAGEVQGDEAAALIDHGLAVLPHLHGVAVAGLELSVLMNLERCSAVRIASAWILVFGRGGHSGPF